jgi:hypothetical protein
MGTDFRSHRGDRTVLCYDPVRGGLAHLGADHEVARVAVGQPATLSLALRLATGALLLTAAEVDDVKVGHAAQGTLRAPVKHPIFGRASAWLAAQNRPTDPPGLTGGTMSAPFSSGLTRPFDGEPGNPKQPLAAP